MKNKHDVFYDMFNELTQVQASFYSKKLANDAEFSALHANAGEYLLSFQKRIESELKDPIKLAEYMPYLTKIAISHLTMKKLEDFKFIDNELLELFNQIEDDFDSNEINALKDYLKLLVMNKKSFLV